MSSPIAFPEANFVWKGWPADATREEVLDLPSRKENGETISCWKVSWKERLLIFLTGKVWLHVHGRQPPVLISGHYPFEEKV